MKGTSTEVEICGRKVRIGDYMEVEYTTGGEFFGGVIKGTVVELWSPEKDDHLQGRLSCGWCFHNHDKVRMHKAKEAV